MPSRRYFITIAPVSHLNGKLAPTYIKCPNTDEPGTEYPGFWYGYKRRSNPSVSRFGVRYHGRDLIAHPITPAEDENRTLFTSSLFAVYDHQQVEQDWQLMLEDYKSQTKYNTPIGFAVASCRANGGEWLEKWTS